MDADTRQVVTAAPTDKGTVDPRTLPRQLKPVEASVERLYGDGADDSRDGYRAIHQKGATAIIPPRQGSTTWKDACLADRNRHGRAVQEVGDKAWKKPMGDPKRSWVECPFFRLKRIFSEKLNSRRVDRQTTEALTRCAALNRMTSLGMPDSYKVA